MIDSFIPHNSNLFDYTKVRLDINVTKMKLRSPWDKQLSSVVTRLDIH